MALLPESIELKIGLASYPGIKRMADLSCANGSGPSTLSQPAGSHCAGSRGLHAAAGGRSAGMFGDARRSRRLGAAALRGATRIVASPPIPTIARNTPGAAWRRGIGIRANSGGWARGRRGCSSRAAWARPGSCCSPGPNALNAAGGTAMTPGAITSSRNWEEKPWPGSIAKPASGTCMACLPDYAELHCLSNFSFLRGASHPAELVERAAALGYSALALTDECSFAGVVRAHVAAKECGLPLILGTEIRLREGKRPARSRPALLRRHLLVDHHRPAARGQGEICPREGRCRSAGGQRGAGAARRIRRCRLDQGAFRGKRMDRRRAALRAQRPREIACTGKTLGSVRLAPRCRRRRPHASAFAPASAGRTDGDTAGQAARRVRACGASECRAQPAAAHAAGAALSAGVARRDPGGFLPLPFFPR